MGHLDVLPMERMLLVELDLTKARCRLGCTFCPQKFVTERSWDVSDAEVDAVVAELEVLLDGDPRDVYLESADILEFAGFERLVDAVRGRGRALYVATPGLKLADRDFAARFVGRGVRFDLTVHGASDAVWEAMTGRPGVRAKVEAALDHLIALGVPTRISTVVTDKNQGELAETLRRIVARWGPDDVAVKLFAPDTAQDGVAWREPGFFAQYPDFAVITEQLAALRGLPGLPTLWVDNLPFCQVDPALLQQVPVRLTPCHNAFRHFALSACAGCGAREICAGLHHTYLQRYRVRRPDVAAAARLAGR